MKLYSFLQAVRELSVSVATVVATLKAQSIVHGHHTIALIRKIPSLVIHADWNSPPFKRWVATATLPEADRGSEAGLWITRNLKTHAAIKLYMLMISSRQSIFQGHSQGQAWSDCASVYLFRKRGLAP